MSYNCENCKEQNTFNDIMNTVFKLAVIGGIGYLAFTFKDTIKEAVQSVVKKSDGVSGVGKSKHLKK